MFLVGNAYFLCHTRSVPTWLKGLQVRHRWFIFIETSRPKEKSNQPASEGMCPLNCHMPLIFINKMMETLIWIPTKRNSFSRHHHFSLIYNQMSEKNRLSLNNSLRNRTCERSWIVWSKFDLHLTISFTSYLNTIYTKLNECLLQQWTHMRGFLIAWSRVDHRDKFDPRLNVWWMLTFKHFDWFDKHSLIVVWTSLTRSLFVLYY